MEAFGVISKVTQPIQWCASMLLIPKSNGTIKICVDFKPLNASVLCEAYLIPKVRRWNTSLCQQSSSLVKLIQMENSGKFILAMKLNTTLIPLMATINLNNYHLEFQVYQKYSRISVVLGLDGTVCHMVDVLILASSKDKHDLWLSATIQQLEKAGVILNPSICVFTTDHVKFCGHTVDKIRAQADPVKTSTVLHMDSPTKFIRLRAVLGHGHQFGKFSPWSANHSRVTEFKENLVVGSISTTCLLRGEIQVTKGNETINQVAVVS